MRDRRGPRPSLASLDFLGDESALQRRVERALQEDRHHSRIGGTRGSDATGSVAVVIGAQCRVEAVVVGREWRNEVGVARFPAALFEAYTAAVGAALEQAALTELQQGQAPPTPSRRTVVQASHEFDEDVWSRATWRTLQGLDTELDRVAQLRVTPVERVITSPNGCLTLRIRASSIVGITGDTGRIARADAGQLQFEARSVLRAFDLAGADQHDLEGWPGG
ncbi:hypothetical protein OHB44_10170 [Micromonospora sp. NBC_00821]|uniref:hypothetical protein n=1 Tax=Micromonospora sp. NBC_00821 TaxID=2975977 RepID=UPI002ED53BC4|nr:hypothetical protein OHB44_10170 [Micromonospora sp. NBC_00821]